MHSKLDRLHIQMLKTEKLKMWPKINAFIYILIWSRITSPNTCKLEHNLFFIGGPYCRFCGHPPEALVMATNRPLKGLNFSWLSLASCLIGKRQTGNDWRYCRSATISFWWSFLEKSNKNMISLLACHVFQGCLPWAESVQSSQSILWVPSTSL